MTWKRRGFSLSPFLFFPFSFFSFFLSFFLLFLPLLNICIWGIKNRHVWRECLPEPAASIYFMPHFKKKRHQREVGAGGAVKPLTQKASQSPGSAPGWVFFQVIPYNFGKFSQLHASPCCQLRLESPCPAGIGQGGQGGWGCSGGFKLVFCQLMLLCTPHSPPSRLIWQLGDVLQNLCCLRCIFH